MRALAFVATALVLAGGCSPDPVSTAPGRFDEAGPLDESPIVDDTAPSPELEWTTYQDRTLAFSIQMPGKVEQQSQRMGQVELYILTSKTNQISEWRCGVARLLTDRPEVTDSDMLDAGVKGELTETGGQLHGATRAISLAGNLGREFTVELPSGQFARQQLIIARPRLFHMRVQGGEAAVKADPVKRFFESLQIMSASEPASAE